MSPLVRTSLRAVALAALVACGGRAAAPSPPPRPAPPPPARAAARPPVTAPPAVTPARCEALVRHAVALAAAERTPAEGAAPALAPDAALPARLAPLVGACATQPAASVACGLGATTLAALEACDRRDGPGAGQATPSSSTSNSSVALPGITPPAPRAP